MLKRDAINCPSMRESIAVGYDAATRSCGLSFSSETDEVWRSVPDDSMRMREALGANQYREILNHDDADLDFLRESGSVLFNHDPNQIAAAIRTVDNKSFRGIAGIQFIDTQFSKDREIEVMSGALKCTSFGYDQKPGARIIPLGEKVVHHGREITGPAILTGFRALEVTLTPIPADSTTGVGRSKTDSGLEVLNMPTAAEIKPEVRKYCRTAGAKHKLTRDEIEKIIGVCPMDNEEVDAEIALTVNERSKPTVAPKVEDVLNAPLTREAIKTITTRAKLANLGVDEIASILETAKDERDGADLILSSVEKRGKSEGAFGGVRAEVGADSVDKKLKYVEGCFARSVENEVYNSRPNTEARSFDDRDEKERGDVKDSFKEYVENEFKDLDCTRQDSTDLARIWLDAMGIDHSGMRGTEALRMCFTKDANTRAEFKMLNRTGPIKLKRDNGAAATSGTASFPYLLENIQTKMLRRLYQRWDPTWMKWCRKGSLPDFKKASRIALSDAGDLLITNENQQPLAANFSDEAEYLQLKKYTRRYSFSWETMIGDGLGGMARTTMGIARAVMRLPSKLVYADLLSNPTMGDNVALFNSAHNNTTTGAMAASVVNTMYTAQLKQKGKIAPQDNATQVGGYADNLDIPMTKLLIPPDIWYATSKLVNPNMFQYSGDGGAGAGATFFTGNVPGVPALEIIVEPRLSNTDVASYSATGFYGVADPASIDAYEVAFLDGSSEPILTQRQDYQTLGWETVVTLPCAVKALEWRALQYSTGS